MSKRILALILTGVIALMMFTGCGASYTKLNNDVIDVTATDVFGNHSIAILGDSMGHGSQTGDIMNNSWPNILKKAINAKTEDDNWGFVSVEGTLWGQVLSNDLHAFPETPEGFKNPGDPGDGWTEYRTAELLGTKGLGSSKNGATLTFSPQERFRYFTVYYQAGPDYGTFEVLDSADNVLLTVDCAASEANYARTDMIETDAMPDDNKIVLKATSDKEVIFTGIGYYNNPDGVVLNNYSNGGLQLAGTGATATGEVTGLDEKFLDLAASSGTMIFALGYNDAYFRSDMELFADKIDHLIAACNENGTKVIVSDTCWVPADKLQRLMKPNIEVVKGELKRLAEETNGIYLDQQDIHGDAIIDTLGDGVHPNAEGHAMIAQAVIEALGLQEDDA